jgi:hypothetical protein
VKLKRSCEPRVRGNFEQLCGRFPAALGLFTHDECAHYAQHCGYRVATSLWKTL